MLNERVQLKALGELRLRRQLTELKLSEWSLDGGYGFACPYCFYWKVNEPNGDYIHAAHCGLYEQI